MSDDMVTTVTNVINKITSGNACNEMTSVGLWQLKIIKPKHVVPNKKTKNCLEV